VPLYRFDAPALCLDFCFNGSSMFQLAPATNWAKGAVQHSVGRHKPPWPVHPDDHLGWDLRSPIPRTQCRTRDSRSVRRLFEGHPSFVQGLVCELEKEFVYIAAEFDASLS